MRQIRNATFETNSSSVHSMTIPKAPFVPGETHSIYFYTGEFGWGFDILRSPEQKASYLYTAIMECGVSNLEYLKLRCEEAGIKTVFDDDIDGYIDHGDDCTEMVDYILSTPERLTAFLFGDGEIRLGNDNEDDPSGWRNCPEGYDQIWKVN